MVDLTIILLTYQRTAYALRTVEALGRYLVYGAPIHWVIADDGSHANHLDAVVTAVRSQLRDGHDTMTYRSERVGYGANANWAWDVAAKRSPVSLWMEDDWELGRPISLLPYVQLLLVRDDVGMVRLGHMPINLNLRSVGHAGRMYLRVEKNEQYAFSGNPHLKHVRFQRHGRYPEGRDPGETEVAYDWLVRQQYEPAIWWPLAIGDAPPFGHIGQEQSY